MLKLMNTRSWFRACRRGDRRMSQSPGNPRFLYLGCSESTLPCAPCARHPGTTMALAEACCGDRLRIAQLDCGEANPRLRAMGLVPGAILEVVSTTSTGSVMVMIQDRQYLGLGADMARCIQVGSLPATEEMKREDMALEDEREDMALEEIEALEAMQLVGVGGDRSQHHGQHHGQHQGQHCGQHRGQHCGQHRGSGHGHGFGHGAGHGHGLGHGSGYGSRHQHRAGQEGGSRAGADYTVGDRGAIAGVGVPRRPYDYAEDGTTLTLSERLQDAPLGSRWRVVGYGCAVGRGYKRKLLAMGLTPGTEIVVTRHAPLGDPTEIEVRGFRLSLRKGEADALQIVPVDPA